jgi:hypothetical protein
MPQSVNDHDNPDQLHFMAPQFLTFRRERTLIRLLFAFTLIFFAFALPSRGQQFAIDWYSISAGGGESSGGNYSLVGTIGQPDAGGLSGGNFSLEGGFLPGIVVPSSTGAPTLVIQASQNGPSISWSPASPGFALEEAISLATPSWNAAPAGNPVTISVPGAARFYRLRKP